MKFELNKCYLITEDNHPPYIMKVDEIRGDGYIRGPYHLVGDSEVAMGLTPIRYIKSAELYIEPREHIMEAIEQLKSVQAISLAFGSESDTLILERLTEVKIILSDLITELQGEG